MYGLLHCFGMTRFSCVGLVLPTRCLVEPIGKPHKKNVLLTVFVVVCLFVRQVVSR